MQQRSAAIGLKRRWEMVDLVWSRRHTNVGQSRIGSRCLLAAFEITGQKLATSDGAGSTGERDVGTYLE